MRLQMGRTCEVTFVVGYALTETTEGRNSVCSGDSGKDLFWGALNKTIRGVPSRDHVLVVMDANARTSGREDGCSDGNVVGAYGRDLLNDNGERRLGLAADDRLCLINTFPRPEGRGKTHLPVLQQKEAATRHRLHPPTQDAPALRPQCLHQAGRLQRLGLQPRPCSSPIPCSPPTARLQQQQHGGLRRPPTAPARRRPTELLPS